MPSGDPEFVILKYQAWLDTTKFESKILGSIVKEFLQPTNNYVPDAPLQKYNTLELTEGSVTDFVLDNSGAKSSEAAANLKSIAGFEVHGSVENSAKLQGRIVRYKRLQQHDQYWARLKGDADVQATVPYWIDRFGKVPVCLVVGIMICEDVELSFEGKDSIEREGHVELPIGAVMLAAGAPNPVSDSLDPKISVGSSNQTVTIFKGKVGESRIFALELKKIAKEGWIKKDLKLKSQGPDVDDTRLAAGDDEDDDDDDEVDGVDELVLGGLSKEEYEDLLA